jgi:hypothetical protein
MAYPAKFRHLMEIEESDTIIPDQVWLAYAVCTAEKDSCGWAGWIIEAAWKNRSADSAGRLPNWKDRQFVVADDRQRCPNCSKDLYRTGVGKLYELLPSQPTRDLFDSVPIEYNDDKQSDNEAH